MSSTVALYDELLAHWRKAILLGSAASLLSWDEQTYLPPGGAPHRAEQLSLLAGMVHERLTSPRIGELILRWNTAASSENRKARALRTCGKPVAAMIAPPNSLRVLLRRSRASRRWRSKTGSMRERAAVSRCSVPGLSRSSH